MNEENKDDKMSVEPKIVTVSEDNNRYKKRKGFRNRGVVYKALIIVAILLGIILLAMKYVS